ncbi:MAG TPA: zinc ribbon domain-containing protein [Clostridiales bacterium]|nr:zinc ribbon domain-containing protein [Clostridiales bacterium]
MFFVAFFGIQDKDQYIGTYNNVVCPSCGSLTRYEIHRTYRYLHIFFIPTFRWNIRYIVRTPCCGSVYELDPLVGREFERNPGIEIRPENLRRIDRYMLFRYCPNCRIDVPAEFSYCPYCGGRLQQ